jgi:tetratricopeptide (TPR) repeat protein
MFGTKGASSTRATHALLAGAMFAWAFFSPASLWGQGSGVNTIFGKVAGPGGRPVEVKVQLQNESGYVVDTVYTDQEGGFTFQSVRDGVYRVFVDDDRFQRTAVTAHVTTTIDPIDHVYLALEPRGGSSPPATVNRGGPHTISARELKEKFPKGAFREYEKGNKKMEQGDVEGAIAHFEKAVALAPEMCPALNNLGNAYLQTHRAADAEAAFRKAVAADPDAPESYVNLGHVYYEMHQYDQAEDALSRGLKRDPNAALAYFFLGLTDLRTGKKHEGEANLQRALDLNDPDVVTAHLILANLYLESHRESQARKQLETFLKLRPQDPQATHIREVLARLKAESTP